jgi:transposase
MEIRLLADHRSNLIAERTRAQNRLRWHLLDLCPELEAELPAGSLDRAVRLRAIAKSLQGIDSVRARVARELLERVSALALEAKRLEGEIAELIKAHRPALLEETGCGPLSAAILIGHTAGAERFASDAQFARMAGVAPIPASSGKTQRHRLHRGGDRQLNHALHVIALTPLERGRAANPLSLRGALDIGAMHFRRFATFPQRRTRHPTKHAELRKLCV